MTFAELKDITISYQDSGVPPNTEIDYTTIILVHGHLYNSHTWDLFIPKLSADYRLIAYDRRGYGQTIASLSTELDSSDLLEFIAHLRSIGAVPSKLVVLGWSAGGFGTVIAIDETPQDQPSPFDAILLYEPPFFSSSDGTPIFPNSIVGPYVAKYFDPITNTPIPGRSSLDAMPQEIRRLCYQPDFEGPGISNTMYTRINLELVSRVIDRIPVGLLHGASSPGFIGLAANKIIELGGQQKTFLAVKMEDTNHFAMIDKPDMLAERVREILHKIL